jgi:hypothetical protein
MCSRPETESRQQGGNEMRPSELHGTSAPWRRGKRSKVPSTRIKLVPDHDRMSTLKRV